MNLSALHDAVRTLVTTGSLATQATSGISLAERASLRTLEGRLSTANGDVQQLSHVEVAGWWV